MRRSTDGDTDNIRRGATWGNIPKHQYGSGQGGHVQRRPSKLDSFRINDRRRSPSRRDRRHRLEGVNMFEEQLIQWFKIGLYVFAGSFVTYKAWAFMKSLVG